MTVWGYTGKVTVPDGESAIDWIVTDSSLPEEMALNRDLAVDVPLVFVICREQGDFGAPDAGEAYGMPSPQAWPLDLLSFTSWALAAGMAEDDAKEAYALYSSVDDPRQKWYQIGNELTLFCGVRALVDAELQRGRASPIYVSMFTFGVPYTVWGDSRYASEGVDLYLTWGQTSATTSMRIKLSDEAIAIGDSMRDFLIGLAQRPSSAAITMDGEEWQPHPAVCEVGGGGEERLACSTQNRHAKACAVFDRSYGRKYDLMLG